MTNSPFEKSHLKAQAARLIDHLCDQYESELTSGRCPKIAEYLKHSPIHLRDRLCQELLRVEIDHRQSTAGSASLADLIADLPTELGEKLSLVVSLPGTTDTVYSRGTAHPVDTTIDDQVPPQIDDHQAVSVIAAGGFGVVWRMLDLKLSRVVALKVMKVEAAQDVCLVNRFETEARICGQLSHPFIVPLHTTGILDDGRHYYLMKLVEGKTLAEILHCRAIGDDPSAGLLQVFLNVCQAIAYAHSKGVIHRDLKPQNIMVGRHGEVQVMDWGLAGMVKSSDSTSHAEPATLSAIRTPRRQGNESSFGVIMGTPQYMAPEQARGVVCEIDRRSDVFALGAILCEILTGKPPYLGDNRAEVELLAEQGDLQPAMDRLTNSAHDPQLIQLAWDCLAFQKQQRPASAEQVTRRVQEYLQALQVQREENLMQIQRQQVQAAEAAKRQRLAIRFCIVACSLALVTTSAGAMLWYQRDKAAQRSYQSIAHAHEFIEHQDFVAAQSEIRAAVPVFETESEIAQIRNDIEFANRLNQIRANYFTWHDGWYDCYTALDQYSNAFSQFQYCDASVDHGNIDPWQLAEKVRRTSIAPRVVSGLDDWAWLAHRESQRSATHQQQYRNLRDHLLAAARIVDPDPGLKDELRSPARWDNPETLLQIPLQLENLSEYSPEILVLIGQLLPAGSREDFLRRCQTSHSDDLWTNLELGRLLLCEITADLPIVHPFSAYPGGYPIANSLSFNDWTTSELDRVADATGFYRAAIAIQANMIGARLDLATALAIQGKHAEAEQQCRIALQHSSDSGTINFKPELSEIHHALGLILRRQGDTTKAIAELRLACQFDDPTCPCEVIPWSLATCLEGAGLSNEADAVFRKLLSNSNDPEVQHAVQLRLH